MSSSKRSVPARRGRAKKKATRAVARQTAAGQRQKRAEQRSGKPSSPLSIGQIIDRALEATSLADDSAYSDRLAALGAAAPRAGLKIAQVGALVALTTRIAQLLEGAWNDNAFALRRLCLALAETPRNPTREAFEQLAINGEALPESLRAVVAAHRAKQQSEPDVKKRRHIEALGYELFDMACSSVFLSNIEPSVLMDALRVLGCREYQRVETAGGAAVWQVEERPANERRLEVVEAVRVYQSAKRGAFIGEQEGVLELLRGADDAFSCRSDAELLDALAKAHGPKRNRGDFGAAAAIILEFEAFGEKPKRGESAEEVIFRVAAALRTADARRKRG